MNVNFDFVIFLVSDGTGDTAGRFVSAALHQFEAGEKTGLRTFPLVRTKTDIDLCLLEAEGTNPLILHTIVEENLRNYLEDLCAEKCYLQMDLLGELFSTLSRFLGSLPKGTAGTLHEVNHRYYQRIEAIEFTLQHDDGKSFKQMHQADIILLGVSRTSKSPTSVYLAQRGYKVINIPIIKNIPMPQDLFSCDQKKIIALTINPKRLVDIRRTRMQRMGVFEGDYINPIAISSEVEYAESLFKKNRQWPVIDVTDRAIEETADHILNILFGKERSIYR